MSEQTNPEEVVYSPEQLKEMRNKQISFYKDHEELLAAQCSFEELKARIEKARLDALKARLERIHIELSMQKEDEDEDTGSDHDIDKKD
jgi:hypothetical protein